MRDPLALFDRLGSRTQSHEVALDDMLAIVGVQPDGHRPWQMVGAEKAVAVGQATLVVHANRVGERRRVGQRRDFRSQVGR